MLTVDEVRQMQGLAPLKTAMRMQKVTIDNLDGLGAVDYSGAICSDALLKTECMLNAPSRCSGMLTQRCGDCGAGAAGKSGREPDSGTVLFIKVATEPEALYAGDGT